ncbi:MAG TPA: enoyl-CoA hydratase-related protein [Myxococcota bacterium]|jgi:enoyl-CoA hydratase/carnithine racemase
MPFSMIASEARGAVQLVTLNRPDRMNAWTPAMAGELASAFAAANEDPQIGAIVLTGAGRGFCAGADMADTFQKRISGTDPGEGTQEGQGGMPRGLDWVALCRASKPLVAAVNGAAVGIGLTQILPFDVIFASDKARFGMGFIKVGLVPELASTHLLVQRVGLGRASELCLSGRLFAADEALACGLVERVVPHDELLPRALELAAMIAANPTPQLAMTKRLLAENAADGDLARVQERESALLRVCWKTPEHKEAVAAFIEKRPPRFR